MLKDDIEFKLGLVHTPGQLDQIAVVGKVEYTAKTTLDEDAFLSPDKVAIIESVKRDQKHRIAKMAIGDLREKIDMQLIEIRRNAGCADGMAGTFDAVIRINKLLDEAFKP